MDQAQVAVCDLKHDRVTIRRHFSLNQIGSTTKAKQIKILPLDAEVKAALEGLPRHLLSPFVFWKGKTGHPFSESWAWKLWKTAAETMGVTVSLYQGTRHSSASAAADRVGVDATQEFLHHTSRRITERYVKQNPDRLKKVLRKPKQGSGQRLDNASIGKNIHDFKLMSHARRAPLPTAGRHEP